VPKDMSNGYEAIAEEFMQVRSPITGVEIVRKWASSLPRGASVLDIGAGSGQPLTRVLIKEGFDVCAIDASPSMVAALRQRFPDVKVACEAVEHSDFFGRTFDGLMAIGLIFLLPEESQHQLIARMAASLKPGGRLLFSAPREIGNWDDVLTGQVSLSLGSEAYHHLMGHAGLHNCRAYVDEGGSNYYEGHKLQS